MAVVQRAVYRPRRPRESPLYRLVEDLFDTLVGVHEERFEPQYGRLRHVARRALERFLDCESANFKHHLGHVLYRPRN